MTSQDGRMEIVILSGACCIPSLAASDKHMEKNIQEALERSGINAKIRTITLSSVLQGKDLVEQQGQVNALFQKHGVKFAPALLIDGKLQFMGGVPTTDQIQTKLTGEGK